MEENMRAPASWVGRPTFPACPSSPISDGSGQRLTRQILGSLDRNEDGIAPLFRVALLLRLDQTVPDLLINRSRFVDLRPSVEPQDAAFRQNAGLAQRRLAHEDRDRRPVGEILRRGSLAA